MLQHWKIEKGYLVINQTDSTKFIIGDGGEASDTLENFYVRVYETIEML